MRNTLPPYPESCAPCDLSKDGWESRHNFLGHDKCVILCRVFCQKNKINKKFKFFIKKNQHECPFSCPNYTRKLKIEIDFKNDELLETIWEFIMKGIILFIA